MTIATEERKMLEDEDDTIPAVDQYRWGSQVVLDEELYSIFLQLGEED